MDQTEAAWGGRGRAGAGGGETTRVRLWGRRCLRSSAERSRRAHLPHDAIVTQPRPRAARHAPPRALAARFGASYQVCVVVGLSTMSMRGA